MFAFLIGRRFLTARGGVLLAITQITALRDAGYVVMPTDLVEELVDGLETHLCYQHAIYDLCPSLTAHMASYLEPIVRARALLASSKIRAGK